MVHYQSVPGVYREEVFPAPVPGLLTGVPVFLGLASRGAVNRPQRLTLWTQFLSSFGDRPSDRYLFYAVRGFFSNGGNLCYVVRLNEDTAPEDSLAEGLEALATLDAIDLICVPDLMHLSQSPEQVQRMQTAVLEYCQQAGDRFALLDALPNATVTTIQQQQQALSSHPGALNGALYFPWIQVEQSPAGMFVPPCGHIAGVYARRDREVGVYQTPANVLLEDVLDLSISVSDADQALLNPGDRNAGINCLRSLPGRGIRIWGGRTLSQDFNWRYINVRRLFLTVARWIDLTLADAAFETNDFKLWVRIERELTTFCESLFQQGALKGSTTQEAFYVKCDAETNPPEVRAAGNVVTEIGLAPAIPNEFIVVRLIHGNAGVVLG
ncbi:MAG: phage tail sheath subtilisin-like domain-containing protein [Leptolyngbyaceae cyanobacterium HOT.MB2.61]|nr:phage tail sheath subtilisin-like domain-containing protein [Leptolyngbyaceae cyanobacterium HOT.MB2.61]